jgi:hypothetical protein
MDLIACVKSYPWEILLCEIAPPSTPPYSAKWYNDRARLITGMKDSLDFLLRGHLNGSTSEEMKKIFILGMQVASTCFLRALALTFG